MGTWTRAAEPLITGTHAYEKNAGNSYCQEPSVINDGTLLRMYYGGSFPEGLCLATCPVASDPTVPGNWTKNAGNPILGNGGSGLATGAYHTNVVLIAGTYYCYYAKNNNTDDLMVATSTDGISWGTPAQAIAKNQAAWITGWANSFVWNEGGSTWKMLVEGSPTSGPAWTINYATSTDGLTWTVQGSGPLTSLIPPGGTSYSGPWLLNGGQKTNGLYQLYYHAGLTTTTTEVFRATSTDAANWTVIGVQITHDGTQYETQQAADPSVITIGATSYLFYSGVNNGDVSQPHPASYINVATAPGSAALVGTCTAGFSTGTSGNAIATSDTGDATAWDTVTSPNITYDTTHVAYGTKAGKIANVNGTNQRYGQWTTAFGTPTTHYFRFYLYLPSLPSTTLFGPITFMLSGSASTRFRITTAGLMQAVNGGSTFGTGAVAIATGQWVRIEGKLVQNSGASGSADWKLWNSPDSIGTPTDEINVSSVITGLGSTVDAVRVGLQDGAGSTYSYWISRLVVGAAAFPGPFPVNTTPCTVTGSAPVGSLLTANAGSWNGGATFTLTYQWTRDGSNIGGATSSTYTTVAGDVGHAIGVTETATGTVATNENAAQASSNTVTATSGGASTYVPIDSFIYAGNPYRRDSSYASTDPGVVANPGMFIPSGGAKTATTSFVFFDVGIGRSRAIWAGDQVAVTDNAYIAAPNYFV